MEEPRRRNHLFTLLLAPPYFLAFLFTMIALRTLTSGTPRIAIVGGGPGGIFAAYELQRIADRPLDVTIFEGSQRLGGKLFSPRFENSNARYEAGAAEFYDYAHFGDDPLKDLVLEMGLTVQPMGGPSVVVDGRVLSNVDDVRDVLGAEAVSSLLAFDRSARDRLTPREFHASGDFDLSNPDSRHHCFGETISSIDCPRARKYVCHMIHSDLAAEPTQTNAVYGMQNYLMNDPAYMRLYGIEGGNERLIEELVKRIDARILLGQKVEMIRRGLAQTMQVRSVSNGIAHDEYFDAVVIALPHDQVAKIDFQGATLTPAIAAHHAHHNHPAHYLRVTMVFDHPFWRDRFQDSYWMLDRFDGCCLYDESSRDLASRYGVLGLLVGGDAAKSHASMSDDQLIEEALASLPASLSQARELLVEARVHRWVGAVSAMPGGRHSIALDRRHQPEPTDHPNLYIVGDYLFDSTLNGVLDSANYVARWIAARVAESRTQ